MPEAPVLSMAVIDDNPEHLEFMSEALRSERIEVHYFSDALAGLEFVRRERPQIVLTDLVMPKLGGMEMLERIVAFDPTIDVIIMTAYYSTESAVEAIRKGATDYLDKPVSVSKLRERVGKLARMHRARLRALNPAEAPSDDDHFEEMIGNSPEMWNLYAQVQRIAPHYRSVLVCGATGSGKELVARALHRLSGVTGPFVALNCSAFVETLVESELFGHRKGAFTGATANKVGLFEHADLGTLFLDEIGDMPAATQAKLLRVLQTQEVHALGSLEVRKVNVRVVAATHRDLRALIREGRFREDLFYRLSMVELNLPSLVDRRGDLELLTGYFVRRWAKQYEKVLRGVAPRVMSVLLQHDWPGNVRELENVLGHAAIMARGELVEVEDLPAYLLNGGGKVLASAASRSLGAAQAVAPATFRTLATQEQEMLRQALELHGGNQSKAARSLEISRDQLRYRMKKYGLL